MIYALRTWLFAIIVLLVAEDFQYILKIEVSSWEQLAAECGEKDLAEGSEESSENKEEKKEETKEKDDKKNDKPENLSFACGRLKKTTFCDALSELFGVAPEQESPPPEI